MATNGPTTDARLWVVEHDLARHELDLIDHEKRLSSNEKVTAVLGAKMAVYASLGAFFGGAVVAVATSLLPH